MKKLIISVVLFVSILVVWNCRYFEVKYYFLEEGISDSFIGLTIDGVLTDKFPTQESGKGIESIVCDKGASGVWDYRNWTLKIQNVIENRTKCQINFTRFNLSYESFEGLNPG